MRTQSSILDFRAREKDGDLDAFSHQWRDVINPPKRHARVAVWIDPAARFHGDQGDLMELLGNLLENAFKWARRRVILTAQPVPASAGTRAGVDLCIEDDGPGIAPENVERLLQRGVRGDERVQGHGIGLAIVLDILRAYHADLNVDGSPTLGGARFAVRIAAR